MMSSNLFIPATYGSEGVGAFCYKLATELFPICRSLTGPGVRQTLTRLQEFMPALTIHEVPTHTQVFDWTVPNEWTIRKAWIETEDGERIIDFEDNNLHVVGYSTPVDEWMELEELNEHLHSLPDQPDAIPYITSYYAQRWGFCLSDEQRSSLRPGKYRAVIDSDLKPGNMTYGELILKGETSEEIFLSTYICHPSMANNELSGPVVTTAIARWIMSLPSHHYTYRIVFVPETIGSIAYLSRNVEMLKKNVVAGFNVTCIGDDRCYSYLPSRHGDTLSDKVALHVLYHMAPDFRKYTWLDRGSDERQYCASGIDLPIATIMRSKYGEYPEYHTSLDNLELVTPTGLEGGFSALKMALMIVENNICPQMMVLGEPQLGKRGLYPNLSTKASGEQVRTMMDVITYSDGTNTLLDIANLIGKPFGELTGIVEALVSSGVMTTRRI
jgi:aminopeptidase-like protein